MTIKIVTRLETYKTGSGWEYQIRQYLDHKGEMGFMVGFHDSLGGKSSGYETEKDALLASKRQLKKMVDSTIKDLNTKKSMLRKFAN